MTDEQLAELEALAEKATEGPWVWYNDDNMYGEGGPRKENRFWPEAIIQTDSGYYGPNEKDRAFIAAARTAVPALIAEVERLRAVAAERAAAVEALRTVQLARLNGIFDVAIEHQIAGDADGVFAEVDAAIAKHAAKP